MATYQELHDLWETNELQHKVAIACAIAANQIRTEDPPLTSVDRLQWAKEALADPHSKAGEMWWAIIADNKDLSVTQIMASSDAFLQTSVDVHVDLFATPDPA